MALSVEEIRAVVGELAGVLVGGRIENVQDRDPSSWVVTVRTPGARRLLVISCSQRFSRLHLVARRPAGPDGPTPLCRQLRARLRGLRVDRIEQVDDDRIVVIGATGGSGSPERAYLVQQLFGPRPNLLLLDRDRRVIASLHPPRWQRVRLSPGDVVPIDEGKCSRLKGPKAVSTARFPVSEELDRTLSVAEAEALLEDGRSRVARRADRLLDRYRRRRAKIEGDLSECERGDRHRQLGELLKGVFGKLRRGLDHIDVIDYFDPDEPVVSITLDPRHGPTENIQRYFRRYRKSRRAREMLAERLRSTTEREALLCRLRGRLRDAGDLEEIDAIDAELSSLDRRPTSPRSASAPIARESGPRRFVSADGHEILVGRSAAENDRLTFRLSRGNDLFLHTTGRPGAHVVVRLPRGKEVTTETLLDAATLAVYYSLPQRSGGVVSRSVAADVDYTPVKFVRKPRGAAPGAVLLARHRSLRVRLDPERLSRLLRRD